MFLAFGILSFDASTFSPNYLEHLYLQMTVVKLVQ